MFEFSFVRKEAKKPKYASNPLKESSFLYKKNQSKTFVKKTRNFLSIMMKRSTKISCKTSDYFKEFIRSNIIRRWFLQGTLCKCVKTNNSKALFAIFFLSFIKARWFSIIFLFHYEKKKIRLNLVPFWSKNRWLTSPVQNSGR